MKATRPRYGRRTNLEARRLLGVEAQDAGLRCRPPAAARGPRRALALLQGAAARPSRRRGPLRGIGLIAGHYSGQLCGSPLLSLVSSSGQRCVRVQTRRQQWHKQQVAALRVTCTLAFPARGVFSEPSPCCGRRRSQGTAHIAEALKTSQPLQRRDTWHSCEPFTQRQLSRTGVATRPSGRCSAPS